LNEFLSVKFAEVLRPHIYIIVLIVLLVSCSGGVFKNEVVPGHEIKVLPALGRVVRSDTIRAPEHIEIEEHQPKSKKAGDPEYSSTGQDIYTASKPRVAEAGIPKICTPGLDTFQLPVIKTAKGLRIIAGVPEVILAKDPYIKDHNPGNFSTFMKLQGLQHDAVSSILQDENGNIWFGTLGGVSKFDGKNFSNFTENQGLANNNIRTMLQDSKGNIWFGTSGGGVSKYDGKYFCNFTAKDGLANNIVMSILEDKSGNIWFGTDGGVSRYDGKTFTTYTDKQGLVNNIVWSVKEDRQGHLWFGTYGGVSKYNGKTFANFTENEGLPSNIVTSVAEDKAGHIWFGTFGGVSRYDGRHFSNYTQEEGLPASNVWALLSDKSGNIWLGTSGEGLVKFDGRHFIHFTDNDGLADNNVMALHQDNHANLWIGTYGGACRYDGNTFSNYTRKDGLPNDQVRSIVQDHEGKMWFGTTKGLSCFNGSVFANLGEDAGLPGNMIWSLTEDRDGNLWAGSDGGVCRFDGKNMLCFNESNGLVNNIVWSVMQDRRGNMWFGTEAGVSRYDGSTFTNFTEREGLVNNFVTCMHQDKKGNIWFGTYGGLSKFDGFRFTNYGLNSGLASPSILSISEDKQGILWFGTEGGLCRYDGKSFINFTEKDGLSNNYIISSLIDRKGNLWLGTRFGLCKLPAARMREISLLAKAGKNVIQLPYEKLSGTDVFFKSYGYYDGFLGIGVNGGKTLCEAKDGTIWIGASDKLVAYHPEGDLADYLPPRIQLTGINLYTEPVNWSALSVTSVDGVAPEGTAADSATEPEKETAADTSVLLGNGVSLKQFYFDGIVPWSMVPLNLNLAYNNNYLTFHFIGTTQHRSKKVRYQYKLEGIDKNWSIPTYSTEASFGNIPPGDFSFLLKAINSHGISSGVFRYSFTIRPPWWQTRWAYAAYLLAFAFSLYTFIRMRTATLRRRQKLLIQKIDEATLVIRQQKSEVEQQRDQINEARKRSDELLENILPAEIASELKANGSVKPVYRDGVSVLFTDFAGFTSISGLLSPDIIVSLINRYFTGFDEIVSKFGVEKIKTIGDAYMLVSGVPNADPQHARRAVETGLAMLVFVRSLNKELQESGLPVLQLRMGIHSGPVVAGIVGLKKFQYDIWGDTVNTASRMESYGEVNRINISEQTYELVKDFFPCEYRGEMEVKGKGKIKMYFIEAV
jgi:ligand-binding sensor domain-containing protein/class 3 adenylate cyclase